MLTVIVSLNNNESGLQLRGPASSPFGTPMSEPRWPSVRGRSCSPAPVKMAMFLNFVPPPAPKSRHV
eukprot:1472780-Prymnesium_polylepis.1